MQTTPKIVAVILLLASCSVGPDYKQPQVYSDEAINKSIGLKNNPELIINHQWYKTFGDEQLNRLVEDGLKSNPDVKSAIEKMQQSRLKLQIARADFGPMINAKGEYSDAKAFQTPEIKTKNDYYMIGFDATWEIDIWGKNRRQTESAKAFLQAAGKNYDNIKISLTAEITKAYINYRLNEKMLQIINDNYRLQSEILQIVEAKYKAGLADDLALEQAKSAQLSSKVQIPDFEIAFKSAQNNLSILTGKLSNQLNFESSDLLEHTPQITTEGLVQLPANVIRVRPDVQYYERTLAAQNAMIGAAIGELFPNLSLSGLLGWQNNTLAPIFADKYEVYSLGGTLSMPIFNWGKLRNNVKLQESVTREAYNDYQKALLNATADVSNSIKNLTEQQNKLKTCEANRRANNKILDLSVLKYQNGLTDFTDVLYAQENKLSSDKEYCQTLASLYIGIAGFYKAIGF